MSTQDTHYRVGTGALGGRYVYAKLGKQRTEREYLVQATGDDRIIVSEGYGSKGTIGCFNVDGSEGRITFKGAHFPYLALATSFEFPAGFMAACLDVCQPLDKVTDHGCVVVNHTVQVIG